MTGLPFRYAGWMTRDLVRGPVFVMLVLGLFFTVGIKRVVIFGPEWLSLGFAVIVTAGIVSRDLAAGYYRSIFARPVSPTSYYLLRWLIAGVFVLLCTWIIDVVLPLRQENNAMIGAPLLIRAGMRYLLVGSLVFLCSTLTRHDWVVGVSLMGLHLFIGRKAAELPAWLGETAYGLLPPFQYLGQKGPSSWGPELQHIILYGTGMLLAALAILQWRPLGSAVRD